VRERLRLLVLGVRTRMLAWYVLLVALAIAGSLLIERQVLLARLDERVAADLEQEYTELRRLIGGPNDSGGCWSARDPVTGACDVGLDPRTSTPFGRDVPRIFDVYFARNTASDGEVVYAFIDGRPYQQSGIETVPFDLRQDARWTAMVATAQAPIRGPWQTPEGRVLYMAVPLTDPQGGVLGVFAVAQFPDVLARQLQDLVGAGALIGFGALLIASVLAWGVTGRLLKPIRLVTDTARDISETDLARRIPIDQTDDEITALARTFNAMLDRLEEAFDIQRRFVDDAGHELRTPITIISGHLELLGESPDPDELKETIAIVTDELDRMTRMVDDLLILAKLERPDLLTLEPIDVAPLTETLRAKAGALGDRAWRVDAVASGRIVADRQRLTQAVMQLAQNATQHTGPGDVIALGSAAQHGEARFWVRDTGTGIGRDDQERIFERFARATGSRRRSEGAGLGLAIVKAIAEAHQGRVELSSRPGHGSTFTIVIPCDRRERMEVRRI
jgi:signal transduction histidine kinase